MQKASFKKLILLLSLVLVLTSVVACSKSKDESNDDSDDSSSKASAKVTCTEYDQLQNQYRYNCYEAALGIVLDAAALTELDSIEVQLNAPQALKNCAMQFAITNCQ